MGTMRERQRVLVSEQAPSEPERAEPASREVGELGVGAAVLVGSGRGRTRRRARFSVPSCGRVVGSVLFAPRVVGPVSCELAARAALGTDMVGPSVTPWIGQPSPTRRGA